MTLLTPHQVAQAAIMAGFAGADLITSVAVSFAEDSDHDSQARYHPPGTGEDSRGLWQINIGGRLWADRRDLAAEHGVHLGDPDALYDPNVNARVAYFIYLRAGRKFGDWATWLHGTYRQHLSAAVAAVASLTSGQLTLHRYLLQRDPMQHGTDVAFWQHVCGALVDGWFGPDTKAATKRWQLAHRDRQGNRLDPDGIVGPLTAGAAGIIWHGPSR